MLIINDTPRTIDEHIDEAKYYIHQMASHMISAGELLKSAKDMIPADKWEDWLDKNFGLSPRNAQRIIAYAETMDRCGDLDIALNRF